MEFLPCAEDPREQCFKKFGYQQTGGLLDAHPIPTLKDSGALTMPYCDNIHVLSCSSAECNYGRDAVIGIHEIGDATTHYRILGGVIDGDRGR